MISAQEERESKIREYKKKLTRLKRVFAIMEKYDNRIERSKDSTDQNDMKRCQMNGDFLLDLITKHGHINEVEEEIEELKQQLAELQNLQKVTTGALNLSANLSSRYRGSSALQSNSTVRIWHCCSFRNYSEANELCHLFV